MEAKSKIDVAEKKPAMSQEDVIASKGNVRNETKEKLEMIKVETLNNSNTVNINTEIENTVVKASVSAMQKPIEHTKVEVIESKEVKIVISKVDEDSTKLSFQENAVRMQGTGKNNKETLVGLGKKQRPETLTENISTRSITEDSEYNNINNLFGLVNQRNKLQDDEFNKLEKEQIMEYQNLVKRLESLKVERKNIKGNIARNLKLITNRRHTIEKCLSDYGKESGLLISYDYKRDATMFFTEALKFVSNLDSIYQDLDKFSEGKVDPEMLTEQTKCCTENVAQELHRMKALMVMVETLRMNGDSLVNHYMNNEEDSELED